MANAKSAASVPFLLPLLFLFLLFFSFISGTGSEALKDQMTWCVAKPSSDPKILYDNLNWACSQVDCSILTKGCPCFYPDNVMNHASIAMNLYYQSRGRNKWNCDFKNSGLITISNPSYGSCAYE